MSTHRTAAEIQGEPEMTSTKNRVMVLICAFWVLVALARIAFWVAGHPGSGLSLTFFLIAGVAGAVGLLAQLLPGRGRS